MLRFIRIVIVAMAVAAITVPLTATAAPSSWQSVDVTLQTEQQQSMLLVSGELPSTAKLPIEAELAVPTGTQVQWIGEILGGAASADPELKYVKSTENGMDLYRFTLTKSRVAQVEGVVQGMSSPSGANFGTALKWTAWQALPEVRVSQRLPKASQIVSAAPGATLQAGDAGFSYYTKTVKNPKAGQVLDLSFTYSPSSATAAVGSPASPSSSNTPALFVILAVFVGGFGFLIYKVRAKVRPLPLVVKQPAKAQSGQSRASGASSASRRGQQNIEQEIVEPAPKRIKPAFVILLAVGVLVSGAVIAGGKGVSANVAGGTIKKSFGAASPCTSASIPVMANQGVELNSQGEALVDSFVGQEGVGDVVLDLDRSVLDIKFCSSLQSEDSIRQILTGTGLVTTGAAPVASAPTSTTVDPSGKTQAATVDSASGSFAPSEVLVKSGIPTELSFNGAGGCITAVIFSELGLNQDLTAGPATVKLPALKPGTYAFACPMGHQEGKLVVQ